MIIVHACLETSRMIALKISEKIGGAHAGGSVRARADEQGNGSDRPELYFVPWVRVQVGADLTRRIQSNQPSKP